MAFGFRGLQIRLWCRGSTLWLGAPSEQGLDSWGILPFELVRRKPEKAARAGLGGWTDPQVLVLCDCLQKWPKTPSWGTGPCGVIQPQPFCPEILPLGHCFCSASAANPLLPWEVGAQFKSSIWLSRVPILLCFETNQLRETQTPWGCSPTPTEASGCGKSEMGPSVWWRWGHNRHRAGGDAIGTLVPNSKTWSMSLDSAVEAHHPSYAIELNGTLV